MTEIKSTESSSFELFPLHQASQDAKTVSDKKRPSPLPISIAAIKDFPTLFEAISNEKKGKNSEEIEKNTQEIIEYIDANQELIRKEIKRAVNGEGLNLSQLAASVGSIQVFKKLIATAPDSLTVVTEFKKPHPSTPNGASLLHLSANKNNLDVLNWLCRPEYFEKLYHLKTESGSTAVQMARRAGKAEALRVLQFHEAREFIADKKRTKPDFDPNDYLMEAISERNLSKVSLLLDEAKANVNAELLVTSRYSYHVMCPISLAAAKGNFEIAKLLLERKAEVVGVKRLPFDAVDGGNVKLIELFKTHGVNFQTKATDSDGNSILHCAALNGYVEVVRHLLKSDKRDLNVVNRSHEDTPLHLAAKKGYFEVVEVLLMAGASSSAKNKFEETPLILAVENGRYQTVKLLLEHNKERNKSKLADELTAIFSQNHQSFWRTESSRGNHYQIAKIVLGKLEKIKAANTIMRCQLIAMAAVSGDVHEVRQRLENKEVSVDAWINISGATILHMGALADDPAVVHCIMEKKGNVNIKDGSQKTSAHYAVEAGNLLTLKALIQHKADLNLCDSNGENPFHLAVVQGQHEIVSFLLARNKLILFLTDANIDKALQDVIRLYAKDVGRKEAERLEVIKVFAQFGYKLDSILYGALNVPPRKIQIIQNELAKLEKAKEEKEVSDKLTESLLKSIDIKNVEGVKKAIADGAAVNLKNAAGNTPLDGVFSKMNEIYRPDDKGITSQESKKELKKLLEIARILVNAGVEEIHYPILTNETLRTQVQDRLEAERLWQGIKDGEPEQVKKAISDGANANRPDEKGAYPLFSAVKEGSVEVIQCLVDAKADLTLLDKYGQTALHLAVLQGRGDIVACLLAAGNNPNVVNKEGCTPLDLVFIEMNRCFKPDKKDSKSSEESADKARRTTLLAIAKGLIKTGATPNYKLLTERTLRDEVKARIERPNPNAFFSKGGTDSPQPETPVVPPSADKTQDLQMGPGSPT